MFYSKYKRKQNIIQKSKVNKEFCDTFTAMIPLIVAKYPDKELVNDTFLKLTYTYNNKIPLLEQFDYQYNLLKGAYKRDDRGECKLREEYYGSDPQQIS